MSKNGREVFARNIKMHSIAEKTLMNESKARHVVDDNKRALMMNHRVAIQCASNAHQSRRLSFDNTFRRQIPSVRFICGHIYAHSYA